MKKIIILLSILVFTGYANKTESTRATFLNYAEMDWGCSADFIIGKERVNVEGCPKDLSIYEHNKGKTLDLKYTTGMVEGFKTYYFVDVSISNSNINARKNITNIAIQVSDFMLDYNTLKGTKVCVDGNIVSMGDMTTLMDKNNEMASINLNIDKLSRNLRKDIMQKCTIMSSCSQVVCGVVQDVMYDKGLIVSEIK